MEKMPYRDDLERAVAARVESTSAADSAVTHWRRALPRLTGPSMTLRELRHADAASLFSSLSSEEVVRFISPPPASIEGFEKFIAWTQRERAAGSCICFGIVPDGFNVAVGLIQVRRLEPGWGNAEWGFAIGSDFWGTGLFIESAELVIDFAFDVLGAHRLEARAALKNGRGNGALRKLGATQEGILRRSFLREGKYLDQVLWTILAADWRTLRTPCGPSVH